MFTPVKNTLSWLYSFLSDSGDTILVLALLVTLVLLFLTYGIRYLEWLLSLDFGLDFDLWSAVTFLFAIPFRKSRFPSFKAT
jgi:hypothetical protein